MWRKIYTGLLITALAAMTAGITGCGRTEDNNGSNSAGITSAPGNTGSVTVTPGNSSTPESADPGDTEKNKATGTPVSGSSTPSEDTKPAKTQKPEVKTGHLSASQQYSDTNRAIKVLGLKEYKKLKSKKYTDTPSKGNKFLVLFLSVENDSDENDYINYNYISAQIDGKNTEHTAVFNSPEKYPTMFDTIEAGKTAAGFIVWEVPSEWKKLEVNYDGWKDIDNLSLKAEFTPGDLSDPAIYNANDYM